ncbi:MAG: hypothetical protein EA399_12100 [Desulfovibrionales bacterium]|nr:MAG: hypothetical protein EA399_12100 [Desulfovibrionales bacterium]
MIRLVWAVLCRDILTDRETNSVSYIHAIEEGAATQLPTRIGPVSLGTLWEMDTQGPEPCIARAVLSVPSGQEIGLLQTGVLTFTNPRHRLHFRLQGLPMTAFGRHEIRLEFSQTTPATDTWQRAATLPFSLRRLLPTPKTQQTQ